MNRLTQAILLIVLFGLLALFYQGLWGDPRSLPTVLIGTKAPSFEGPDVETGETISFEQFRGKVVLLNFWASWCYECKVEHQDILRLHREFQQYPDFVMLGVNYQDKIPDALAYLRRHGSTFRHVRDVTGSLAIDYGVYGVPETFVIDRDGIIRHKWVGPIVGPTYTNLTQKVLLPLLKGAPETT